MANIQSFASEILGVIGPLGENLDFFSTFKFGIQKFWSLKPKKSSYTQSEL